MKEILGYVMEAAVWKRARAWRPGRRSVACGVAALLLAGVGVLRATSVGSAHAESFAGGCAVLASVDGESRCVDTNPQNTNRQAYRVLGFPSNEGIDAVYTWVDPLEKVWKHQKHALVGVTASGRGSDLSDERRFNNGKYPDAELCASLDLLRLNMPWIRHVWILTARPQQPTCAHPGMRVVHHDDVGLPATFNSGSIETSVHLIPGLSARFVYLNDDFYVLRPMPASAFFAPDGRPIVWTEPFKLDHIFRTCVHRCEATNKLVKPLLRGKSMLHLLHGPRALTVAILNATVSLPSLAKAVRETKVLHLTRRDDDFLVMNAAQNLAVAKGMALLSTAVPTLRMIDGVQTAPFRRHVDLACINGAVLDTADDVARLRASLRLKP